MRRREFLAAAATLLVSSRRSFAQQTRRRIGFLAVNELLPSWQSGWLTGLRNHGWVDGSNLTIEYRYGRSPDRLPALAAELVTLRPELIMAGNPQSTAALKSATSSIPIVFVGVADPVAVGFVQSLSRPGGNITGLASFVPGHFVSKQLQLIRELVPGASKVAILTTNSNPSHRKITTEELPQTARQMSLDLPIVAVTTAEELDAAFATVVAQRADAIVILGDPLFLRNRARLGALATKHRLPSAYLIKDHAIEGGLVSYGPDWPDLWLHAGGYVDKLLKGSKPADLPVEQPAKYEFVINLRTAKELGITVPPQMLAIADVIE
ncbi:ABC transporter substrate-binding protein [Bradyrhizobium sp.]|uniref:ABC transporter substrate-binding protein n=1 Tax=Bradyrhizobium sp. TaxID=376 RepID=UPI001E0ACD7C|nr:ABC transporter substrate-binding protein [Bradyrhizobium sp.]MBI5320540.1 ABC transporter substrate-binding protein [Bradyrhizobium sp.]